MKIRHILMATAVAVLPMCAAHAQPVSGLYVATGIGANFLQPRSTTLSGGGLSVTGNLNSNTGPVTLLSLGWGFGNGWRTELEGGYRQNTSTTGGSITSPRGNEQKAGAMVNIMYDFVGLVPFTQPYAGVGAGFQEVLYYKPDVGNSANGSFAYQAILGTAVPIPAVPGLSVTAEYRFMGLAGSRTRSAIVAIHPSSGGYTGPGSSTSNSDYNHALLIGLRYSFGAAPVAAAQMPAADTGAKTFLVFFDWSKAELTGRSAGIVRDAAAYSIKSQYTRIDVDGNADTSGAADYNQGLSERRARVVAAELVRDGVPQTAISMHAYGGTKLLVPTGPGTREPQNRRVEIVFH